MFAGQKIANLDRVANTWMRAPGESIATFALASAIDELAYAMKIDPIELRRINEPQKDPTKGTEFSMRNLVEAYRRRAEKFGWRRRNPQRDGAWLIGQGVATAYYPVFRWPAKVRVRNISSDGTASVHAAAHENGNGNRHRPDSTRRRASGHANRQSIFSIWRFGFTGFAHHGGRLQPNGHHRGRGAGRR